MAEQRVQRRLAAILAADVVGYSRLMRADESGTLAQLKVLQKELLDPKVAEYGGRIVKTGRRRYHSGRDDRHYKLPRKRFRSLIEQQTLVCPLQIVILTGQFCP